MSIKAADQNDRAVGRRIRAAREKLRISQTALDARLCNSPGQVGKYEVGANRIAATRVADIADWLGPIRYTAAE